MTHRDDIKVHRILEATHQPNNRRTVNQAPRKVLLLKEANTRSSVKLALLDDLNSDKVLGFDVEREEDSAVVAITDTTDDLKVVTAENTKWLDSGGFDGLLGSVSPERFLGVLGTADNDVHLRRANFLRVRIFLYVTMLELVMVDKEP